MMPAKLTCEFVPSVKDASVCKICGGNFFDHKPIPSKKTKTGRKRKLPPAREAEIVEWARLRGKPKEKAAEYGISIATLYSILHRNGKTETFAQSFKRATGKELGGLKNE
jgi:hypothetical protein